jgi:hypothetical protein
MATIEQIHSDLVGENYQMKAAVFGERRLNSDRGHVARPALTHRFIKLVQRSCEEPLADRLPSGVIIHKFSHDSRTPFVTSNDGDFYNPQLTDTHNSIAAVHNARWGRALRKPRDMAAGVYAVSECVYYDAFREQPWVEGTLQRLWPDGADFGHLLAQKPATDQDVERACDRLLIAAYSEQTFPG